MTNRQKFSVSIDGKTLGKLKEISKKESISVNGLINQTLENYIVWNLHNTEFIPIRKALISKFLDKFSHEEIESIATNMAHTKNKDTVLKFTDNFDASNILKTFERWLRLTGFPYSYEVKGAVHRFIVLHDLGTKWSIYLTKLLSSTLVQFDIIPRYEYTDKILSITMDFSEPKDAEERIDKQIEILKSTLSKMKAG